MIGILFIILTPIKNGMDYLSDGKHVGSTVRVT